MQQARKPEQMIQDILIEKIPLLPEELKKINEELVMLENNLENLGTPWTPGRIPEWKK